MEDLNELKVKGVVVGKVYKLRNGLITSPIRLTGYNAGQYRFEANVVEPNKVGDSIINWKLNGRAVHNSIDHRLDIVELIE